MHHFKSERNSKILKSNPSVSTADLIFQRLLSDQRKTHCIYLSIVKKSMLFLMYDSLLIYFLKFIELLIKMSLNKEKCNYGIEYRSEESTFLVS